MYVHAVVDIIVMPIFLCVTSVLILVMLRPPPGSTRPAPLFPYPTFCRAVPGDPSAIADAMKVFGQAFQMTPLSGVHLASAGMHHGGCASFYQGALNVGQALAIMGKFDAEAALAMIERHGVTTAYLVPTQFEIGRASCRERVCQYV